MEVLYDLKCCIASICKSDSSWTCKDLENLRRVCKSFATIITVDDLHEKVVDHSLYMIHLSLQRNIPLASYKLPISEMNMVIKMCVYARKDLYLFSFTGPLAKDTTERQVLNMCLKTLSGLYKFDNTERIHLWVDLHDWRLPSNGQTIPLGIPRPLEQCQENNLGLLHVSAEDDTFVNVRNM
jgi:hypothetical protein